MRQVYRMTLRIGEFNDMLLQNFEETVIKDPSEATVTPINSRWQARNNHLELVHPQRVRTTSICTVGSLCTARTES